MLDIHCMQSSKIDTQSLPAVYHRKWANIVFEVFLSTGYKRCWFMLPTSATLSRLRNHLKHFLSKVRLHNNVEYKISSIIGSLLCIKIALMFLGAKLRLRLASPNFSNCFTPKRFPRYISMTTWNIEMRHPTKKALCKERLAFLRCKTRSTFSSRLAPTVWLRRLRSFFQFICDYSLNKNQSWENMIPKKYQWLTIF